MALIIFWSATLLTVYAYIGYPLVLWALSLLFHRPVRKEAIRPSVSLLIPAYNERRVIGQKIENSLALDYPRDRLEIVVASDGSNDDTVAIAARLADGDHVRLLAYPNNRGKMATLNASIPELRGEILVFSDASAVLDRRAIEQLTRSFADPNIGAVSGHYAVANSNSVDIGTAEQLYWKYESFIKECESRVASIVGGHGHLFAIRKNLYPYPNADTVNDDYVIPLSVLAKGYRAVYEPNAQGYEDASEMGRFTRRVRVMAGNVQQLREAKRLLRPFQPLPLFFLLSHKACRLMAPLALLAMFLTNPWLISTHFYAFILCIQILFYFLAGLGAVFMLRPRMLMLPYYFSMINVAAFCGWYHGLTARRGMAWK